MGINITSKKSRNQQKIWYTFEWGKEPNQRKAAGVFTYVNPKNAIQKNYNKEALELLENKKAQLTIESQAVGSGFIPRHKLKNNFLDYYADFVKNNKKEGNRHLEGSLSQFKQFLKKSYLSPLDITENLCTRFRAHLLKKLTGKSPSDYFQAFKRVVKTAWKEGYFRINPAEDVKAKRNPSKKIREFLTADEYLRLLNTPIHNQNVKEAFLVSCYTGLRWCDVNRLKWEDIAGDEITTCIIQAKTGQPVLVTMHPTIRKLLDERRVLALNKFKNRNSQELKGRVFDLPTADGCNKSLKKWMADAKINKYITWHCARLSFSILLQDANVDTATVALLLGHTTSRYVYETYKRHRPKDQTAAISHLPSL